jgi:hypothetical protein
VTPLVELHWREADDHERRGGRTITRLGPTRSYTTLWDVTSPRHPDGNLAERFILTRACWTEEDADAQARILSAAAERMTLDATYFVLVVRVSDPPGFADPAA